MSRTGLSSDRLLVFSVYILVEGECLVEKGGIELGILNIPGSCTHTRNPIPATI